jgi:hypothetical protein
MAERSIVHFVHLCFVADSFRFTGTTTSKARQRFGLNVQPTHAHQRKQPNQNEIHKRFVVVPGCACFHLILGIDFQRKTNQQRHDDRPRRNGLQLIVVVVDVRLRSKQDCEKTQSNDQPD